MLSGDFLSSEKYLKCAFKNEDSVLLLDLRNSHK